MFRVGHEFSHHAFVWKVWQLQTSATALTRKTDIFWKIIVVVVKAMLMFCNKERHSFIQRPHNKMYVIYNVYNL